MGGGLFVLTFPNQETPWAAKTKRGAAPIGLRCMRCSKVHRLAFPLLGWDALRTQKSASPEVEQRWREACANFDAAPPAETTYRPENFLEQNGCGYRFERPCELWDEAMVLKAFGVRLKDISHLVPIDTVMDPYGKKHQGLLVSTGPPRVILYSDMRTQYEEMVHTPAVQLRSKQGHELCQFYREDLSKIAPRGWSKQSSGPLTEAEVKRVAEKVLEDKQLVADQKALRAAGLQPSVEGTMPESGIAKPGEAHGDAPGEAEEAESHDDEYEAALGNSPTFKGPSAQAQNDKKKRPLTGSQKWKGAGKAKAKAGQKKRRLNAKTCVDTMTMALETGSQASATGSSTSKAKSSVSETADAKWQFHMGALKIDELLAGHPLGKELWQAKRAVAAMVRDGQNVHAVLMKGHISLFEQAEKILPKEIKKISANERHSVIKELQANRIYIAAWTRAGLLECAALDLPIAERVPLLTPVTADELQESANWDGLHPTVRGSGIPDTDLGKIIQRCVIADGILPRLQRGEPGRVEVSKACWEIMTLWLPLVGEQSKLPSFLEFAVKEVCEIAAAMAALLNETSVDGGAESVQHLMAARKGVKLIVKQARGHPRVSIRHDTCSELGSLVCAEILTCHFCQCGSFQCQLLQDVSLSHTHTPHTHHVPRAVLSSDSSPQTNEMMRASQARRTIVMLACLL